MGKMIIEYGGPYSNLAIASAPGLLRELGEGIAHLGLDESEMRDRYEADPDDNDRDVGTCYLLMAHAFVRAGVENGHLVWFIK